MSIHERRGSMSIRLPAGMSMGILVKGEMSMTIPVRGGFMAIPVKANRKNVRDGTIVREYLQGERSRRATGDTTFARERAWAYTGRFSGPQ